MEVEIGRGKKGAPRLRIRRHRGSSRAVGRATPDDVDINVDAGAPTGSSSRLLASAMDGVVSPGDGRHPRSPSAAWRWLKPRGHLDPVRGTGGPRSSSGIAHLDPRRRRTREMQEIYSEPVKPELIAQRIE